MPFEVTMRDLLEAGVHFGHQTKRWDPRMKPFIYTARNDIHVIDLKQKEKGIFEKLPTKEVSKLKKELARLEFNLCGILEMTKQPDAIFVIDTVKEDIAVREARRLGIKVVAVVDTNSNPLLVDVPIPGNDDAILAIKLMAKAIADACLEGTKLFVESTGGVFEESGDVADEASEMVAAIEKEEAILETENLKKI